MACDGPPGPDPPPSQACRQGAFIAPENGREGMPPEGSESGAGKQECSNSLFTARSGHADSAGADTVKFLYRVSEIEAHAFRSQIRNLEVVSEGSGELVASGLRCGQTELATRAGAVEPAVWVEGRPDQLFYGRGHDALLPMDRLPEADEIIRESLQRAGVHLAGSATEVGRIDTTASLELPGRPALQASLRAFRSSPPPRRKVSTYEKRGVLETVAFVGQRGKVYERIYAEGPTHGADRERFLRFESQNRYQSRTRLPLSEWSADRAQDQFARRFAAHRERVGVVTIGSVYALSDELARLHSEGQVSLSGQSSLLAYLIHRERGNHLAMYADRTMRRYESELVRLGLSLEAEVTEPIRVDLQAMLDRATTLDWASA